MRLLIIGRLSGELVAASKIAMQRGAAVTQADAVAQGLNVLRAKGADLIMIDVAQPIATLVAALDAERIRTPVVACGTGTDARAAVAAIQAGAREYIPLPPDPELIAAVIEAVAADSRSFVWRDAAMERVVKLAEQIARSEATRADHRRERHRQGGAGALRPRNARPARTGPSSRSTAPRSRTTSSNPSCSATRRARSRERSRAASASSRRRTAARFSSTRSPRWTCACRRSSCARSRSG